EHRGRGVCEEAFPTEHPLLAGCRGRGDDRGGLHRSRPGRCRRPGLRLQGVTMEAWHAMAVMSAGMLKFLFSPIVSYQFGHNYLETVLLTGLGGGLGMLIFFRGGQQ